MKTLKQSIFSVLLFSSSLAGAHTLDAIDGNYHGSATMNSDQKSLMLKIAAATSWDGSDVQILIKNLDGSATTNKSWTFTLTELRRNKASISGLGTDDINMATEDSACYSNADATVRFCGNESSIQLTQYDNSGKVINLFDLVSDNSKDDPTHSKIYTLDELRTLGFNHSFDTQVEFEHTFQAHQMAKVSRLNLLPHLSIGSVIPLAVADMSGTISAVGDVAPFLLPNRWLQARENGQRSQAENDTLVLVKSDSGFLVENLALGILRDQEILAKLKSNLMIMQGIQSDLEMRVYMGTLPKGDEQYVPVLIDEMNQTINTLTEGVQEEYAALAQGVGFTDQDSIAGIIPLTSDEITTVTSVNDDSKIDAILDGAFELKQLDHLILAAKASRGERWFQWMDPAGDPSGGFGVALPAYISIGTSQIREMQVRREQMVSILTHKLSSTVGEANTDNKNYSAATLEANDVKELILTINRNIEMGTSFVPSSLSSALQNKVTNDIEMIGYQYSFLIAKAALNRLEMAGPYSVNIP